MRAKPKAQAATLSFAGLVLERNYKEQYVISLRRLEQISSIGSLNRTKDKHGTKRKTKSCLIAVFVTIILISLLLPSFLNLVSVSAAFGTQPVNLIDVTVGSGGKDYTTPAIILVGGGGTGATATARVCNGVIYGIVLTNPGNDYTSAPTVIIIDPKPKS